MNSSPQLVFTVNGLNYDRSKLSPAGQELLALITDAQTELLRLDNQKKLLDAAQQHLISQLKPHLPQAIHNQETVRKEILGNASQVIPTTPTNEPEEDVSPFPENVPSKFLP